MLKGVDIGGSFVKVLWENGKREKYDIRKVKNSKDEFLRKLTEIITEGDPDGVGIAVAGFTSLQGKVYKSPNIPVLDGVDFELLLKDSGIPFVIGNDVSVASFGEWFFDHRDSQILILIAVGTGLGGGLVVEGKPFLGSCGSAMEAGHQILIKNGRLCNCGRKGCWEAYCSSYGLERTYRELGGYSLKNAEIIKRAKEGEKTALQAVEIFKEFMALGIMNLLHLINPDRVVLGGGIVEGLKDLLVDLEGKVKNIAEELPAKCFKLYFSSEGEYLGARGALALIKRFLSDTKADGR